MIKYGLINGANEKTGDLSVGLGVNVLHGKRYFRLAFFIVNFTLWIAYVGKTRVQ